MQSDATITRADIERGLRELGIDGWVEAHTSLSAFGRVEGGARAVAEALAAVFPLVMVPAFTYGTVASPPEGAAMPGNGEEPRGRGELQPEVFTPGMPVSRPIGAVPEALRKFPGACRGSHPIESFAAVGEGARALVDSQTLAAPLTPIERLIDAGGWIVMLGTDLTSCTPVHLAEERAGRRLFVRWCVDARGRKFPVRVSGCSLGFGRLETGVAGAARETRIGAARVRAYPGEALVRLAAEKIAGDRESTICATRCARCLDASAGGPMV